MQEKAYIPTPLTFLLHADFEALFKSAELALAPVVLVHQAVLLASAAVGHALPHRPLEETFAAFEVV